MNYNKLKYFYEIAKIQNLSHASNVLFVSQSSLSKTIADLEKDFGTALFTRTNRNLVLTNAGKELQRQIEPFFSKENDIYNAVRAAGQLSSENISATLDVGFMTFDATLKLSDFIHTFTKEYPAIQIHPYRYNKNELMLRLKRHSLDLAFVIFSMDELSGDFPYKTIAEYHMSIIAREDHPLSNRYSVSLSELKNENFIMHGHDNNSNEYTNAIAWCKRNGFYPKIIGEYDYVETVLMLVQSGMGISLLSDAAPISNMKGLVNIPLENSPVLYGGIFWNPHRNEKAIHLFMESFLSYFL